MFNSKTHLLMYLKTISPSILHVYKIEPPSLNSIFYDKIIDTKIKFC
jgi:hypothetical protein